MEFLTPQAFIGLIALFAFFFIKGKKLPFSKEVADKIVIKSKISKKTKFYLLVFTYVLLILALARPVINQGFVTIKAPIDNIVIGLDISKEMKKTDLYPNREKFAQTQIARLLTYLKSQNVSLILFDKNTYLISPPTQDYQSVIYLLKHASIKNMPISNKPDIPNFVNQARKLVKNPKIVIFTSQKYLPKTNEFVYFTSKEEFKAKNVFLPTYSSQNIKKLANILNKAKNKDIKIKNQKELFYYPLAAALMILLFVIFIPLGRNR